MTDPNPTLTAVDKLTQPWGHLFGPRELGANNYKRVEYDPLLDSLRAAIGSSLGKTSAGASADNARNALNLKAFDLWELIDGIVRSMGQRLGVQRSDDLKQVLRRVYVKVAAMNQDATEPREFKRLVCGWVASINDMFDPPVVKELIADCPMPGCGERYWKNDSGDLESAMIAYYRPDSQPEAKCRCCGAMWSGERALLNLGYSIGATADEEALREMGVHL